MDTLPLDGTHYSSESELKERTRLNREPAFAQSMDGHIVVRPPKGGHTWRFLKNNPSAEKIDYVSRMLFPLTFVLFNAAYWLYYLPH